MEPIPDLTGKSASGPTKWTIPVGLSRWRHGFKSR